MNTSIITSQTNSLPRELIIKLVYYLDEESLSNFTTTCKFINEFNFGNLLIPYKIVYDYEDAYYMGNENIADWFKKTLTAIYYNNNLKHYLQDLVDTCDKISIYNITGRIKTVSHIIYSNLSTTRHQCIRIPIDRDSHQFRIDERPTDRRYIKSKQHCILNINRFTYSFLRNKHFSVLALMY